MSGWKTPPWHGECPECGAVLEARTASTTNAAMATHGRVQRGHEAGWVAVCGCGERFGPGSRAEIARALKKHLSQRDYEPLALIEGDA